MSEVAQARQDRVLAETQLQMEGNVCRLKHIPTNACERCRWPSHESSPIAKTGLAMTEAGESFRSRLADFGLQQCGSTARPSRLFDASRHFPAAW